MKPGWIFFCSTLVVLGAALFCGCSNTQSESQSEAATVATRDSDTPDSETEAVPEWELKLEAGDDISNACLTAVSAYFESMEQRDFEAYRKTIYPLYAEQMEAYLQESLSYGLETSFETLCSRFDSTEGACQFTRLVLEWAPDESEEAQLYVNSLDTLLGVGFADQASAELDEVRTLFFSLYGVFGAQTEESLLCDAYELILVRIGETYYIIG